MSALTGPGGALLGALTTLALAAAGCAGPMSSGAVEDTDRIALDSSREIVLAEAGDFSTALAAAGIVLTDRSSRFRPCGPASSPGTEFVVSSQTDDPDGDARERVVAVEAAAAAGDWGRRSSWWSAVPEVVLTRPRAPQVRIWVTPAPGRPGVLSALVRGPCLAPDQVGS